MRTNIVIADQLLDELIRVTGVRSKKEAVDLGLRALLKLSRQAAIHELRGTVAWEGDLHAARLDESGSPEGDTTESDA